MGTFTEMSREIFYCKSWFRAKKRPTELWSEDRARGAHDNKTLYSALIDSVEKPFCFLEINDKFVGVGFLDDNLRERVYYAFREIEPGRLFLSMATYREFEGDLDKVLLGTTYMFDPSGAVKIQKQQFNPYNAEASETVTDVSGNYDARPEFGHYGNLIKLKRAP